MFQGSTSRLVLKEKQDFTQNTVTWGLELWGRETSISLQIQKRGQKFNRISYPEMVARVWIKRNILMWHVRKHCGNCDSSCHHRTTAIHRHHKKKNMDWHWIIVLITGIITVMTPWTVQPVLSKSSASKSISSSLDLQVNLPVTIVFY